MAACVTGGVTNWDKIIARALCSPGCFGARWFGNSEISAANLYNQISVTPAVSFFNEYWMYTDPEMMTVQNIFRFLKVTINFGKHCQHKKGFGALSPKARYEWAMTFIGLVSMFVNNVQLRRWRDQHQDLLLHLQLRYSLSADTCIAATGQKASMNRQSSLIGLAGKYILNIYRCAFAWCWATTPFGFTGVCCSSVLPRMRPKVPAVAPIKYKCSFIIDAITSRTKP